MNDLINVNDKSKYWWIPFLSGLVLLFFGIWFFTAPLESFQTLTIVFGFLILLSGILEIYIVIRDKKAISNYLSFLWGGVLNIILGLLLIINPNTILVIISFIIGFWLIFKGGELIKHALELKKANSGNWKNSMLFGFILIIVAAILLWHPDIIGFTIALWTSIAFVLLGIFRIYLALKIRSFKA